MTRAQRNLVIAVVAIAVVVLIVIGTLRRGSRPPAGTAPATAPAAPATQPRTPASTAPAWVPKTPPAGGIPAPPAGQLPPAERAKAMSLLERGLQGLEGKELIAARSALADALNTGALSARQADAARGHLTRLAQRTLFSPRRFQDDPCVVWYRFKRGEVLARVERTLKLHVPAQLLLKINGIPEAEKIQAGQTLKFVRGPFHAVITKSRFTMDVYLEQPDTKRMIFVKRFRVGVGQDGSTPTGRWRVALGRKMKEAPWTPPSSSRLPRRKILYGQKGYPLGRKGYWISLEGIEGNIYAAEDGYGIHGTHDANSIGRASSMGCIRLVDEDIEQVFALLYEHWSTVTVRK